MPIRRYNQTAAARDGTGSLGTTTGLGGTILLTGGQTATGTYSSGPAGATEYFLGDITATGTGLLTFDNYVGIIGWPELIDAGQNPATMAQIAANEAAPDNWLFDENTGLVVPARRMKITLAGQQHGNAGFVVGVSTDIVFVGVDFYVANAGVLNVGGANGVAAVDNRIRFYNCRVFVEGTAAFRFRGFSQDMQVRGLQVISNGPTDFTTEFIVDAAGRPTVFDNFRMVSTNLTTAGADNLAGTQNGPQVQTRQLLFPNVAGDGTLRGLEANSMTFFTFANRAVNLVGTYTLINPQVNIIKTMDQGFSVATQQLNAFANQWLVINREILPTAITTGGTAGSTAGEQPDVTVVRRPTGLAFTKEANDVTFQNAPLVPVANPVDFTGHDAVVYNVDDTTLITGALTVSNDGELTGTLLHYFDSVPTTTVDEVGPNGPIVQMYNRYRIALTRYGFSAFILDDHFIGGECPATHDANDAYFGLVDLANRRRYSPLGESLAQGNTIDLPIDGFVTETTEATVAAYTTFANLAQVYDGVNYHASNRLDGERLQIGVQLASVNSGNIDFGSRNLVMTETAITQAAATGALTGLTGVATGDITLSLTSGFSLDAAANGISGISTTGTVDMADAPVKHSLAAGTINNLRSSNTLVAIPSGVVVSGTVNLADGDFVIVEGDASAVTWNLASGTASVFARSGGIATPANASGAGTIGFPFEVTFTTSPAADITIRLANGTFVHSLNTTSVTYSSAVIPAGAHRIIASTTGRSGTPMEITLSAETTINVSSLDLAPLGYDSAQNIGTSRTYSIETDATFAGTRDVLISTETSTFDYLTNPLHSVKWFGDLYGAQNAGATRNLFNEVILENFDITEDTDPFTLVPASSVTSVNLPLIQAQHGAGIPSFLEFNADISPAVGVAAGYTLTDAYQPTSIPSAVVANSGVSANPQQIGQLAGTISSTGDRVIEAVNANTDAERATVVTQIETSQDIITDAVEDANGV